MSKALTNAINTPVYNGTTGASQWPAATTINSSGAVEAGRYVDFHAASSEATDYTVRLDGGTAGSTTLTLTGNFTATQDVTAYSDVRVKTNIETISNALNKVLALRGVYFNRIDTLDNSRQIGVIAQEIQKIIPEAVKENEDGKLSVAYGNLVGLLIEAIKELKIVNDSLRTRIEMLEGK